MTEDPQTETGSGRIARLAQDLRLGQWTAWALVAIYLAYLVAVALSGVVLRMIGVIGYGLVFPVVCFVIGLVFRVGGHQLRETIKSSMGIQPT